MTHHVGYAYNQRNPNEVEKQRLSSALQSAAKAATSI